MSLDDLKSKNEFLFKEKIAKRKLGRPSAFCPRLCRKVYKALINGNTENNAARLVGISTITLQNWKIDGLKHLRECKLEWDECRTLHEREAAFITFIRHCNIANGIAAQRAVNNITRLGRTELRANTWFLERKHPDEWGSVQEINVNTHSVVEHIELSNVDSKQRLLMADAMRKRAMLQIEDGVIDTPEIITPQDSPSVEES